MKKALYGIILAGAFVIGNAAIANAAERCVVASASCPSNTTCVADIWGMAPGVSPYGDCLTAYEKQDREKALKDAQDKGFYIPGLGGNNSGGNNSGNGDTRQKKSACPAGQRRVPVIRRAPVSISNTKNGDSAPGEKIRLNGIVSFEKQCQWSDSPICKKCMGADEIKSGQGCVIIKDGECTRDPLCAN